MKIWKKIKEKKVYDGYRKIIRKTFLLPNGLERDFDIVSGEHAVGVVALTPRKEVLLVQQFRPGTEQIYDELPAGIIEKDEEPLAAAKRELLEETGYTGDFEFVAACVDDAYRSTIRYCFVAKNCHKIKEPQQDETEFIDIITKTLEEFKSQIRSGKLTDVELAYLGLDYLKLLS
ncbi:MAG: hypothetical protein RL557_644 [archaeon]|jgi:ADP-ribose pyrophosphatase